MHPHRALEGLMVSTYRGLRRRFGRLTSRTYPPRDLSLPTVDEPFKDRYRVALGSYFRGRKARNFSPEKRLLTAKSSDRIWWATTLRRIQRSARAASSSTSE